MAAMHQDTSEDREVVNEKLKEIFGVRIIKALNTDQFFPPPTPHRLDHELLIVIDP